MDITDPEQEETVTANDWQPENSTVGSHLFPAEQNGSESLASSRDEEVDDPLSECPDSPTPQPSPASQLQLSLARREISHDSSLDKKNQNTMNEDGEVSGSSEDEESEDEDAGEEEEAGSEDELENGNNKEEGEESASSAAAPPVEKDGESKKASFSLYSGVSDIISGSCSSPSSNSSTPSLPPNKATTPSPSLQSRCSSLVNKSGGGGLLVHHPVTPKKRVVNKTNTDHLSDELNLGYRILMELMSDYQKGSNTPFMEQIEMEPEKNKDYLEVVKRPLWLKKNKPEWRKPRDTPQILCLEQVDEFC